MLHTGNLNLCMINKNKIAEMRVVRTREGQLADSCKTYMSLQEMLAMRTDFGFSGAE